MIDFVATWSEQTELPATRLVGWLGLGASKYFDWQQRYGKANEHNATVPRDHWLEPWEQHAIVDRKSTRLNSSHIQKSRMPSSA